MMMMMMMIVIAYYDGSEIYDDKLVGQDFTTAFSEVTIHTHGPFQPIDLVPLVGGAE